MPRNSPNKKNVAIKRKYTEEDNTDNKPKRAKTVSNPINKANIWEKMQTYIPPDKWEGEHKDHLDWVSATKIKNYLMKDALLDWLDLYKRDHYLYQSQHPANSGHKDNRAILFKKGNSFEANVLKYLSETFPHDYVQVAWHVSDITPAKVQVKAQETVKLMQEGKPIIAQAVLFNFENKTFGCADLIIRSDWINKLFENKQLTDEEAATPAPNLHAPYHYRVIDIKWTTLKLCADGVHLRNSDLMLAYKGQLAIYNCAVGYIQGYTPGKAYILGKTWKYTQQNADFKGYNCFQLMGHIDYEDPKYDNNYIEQTCQAIKWIRTVRYYGRAWEIYPVPSVPELYPNMSNSYDEPHGRYKRELAKKLCELTMLWEVGPRNRCIGHKNGIYSWKDERCSASLLGINGPKTAYILDKIIKINQTEPTEQIDKLQPRYITKCSGKWQKQNELDFYVDFETITDCFMNDYIDIFDSNNNGVVIFMIGVGYIENHEWKFKTFKMEQYSYEEEARILNEFKNFIKEKTDSQNAHDNHSTLDVNSESTSVKQIPRFFHWSHAEKTFLASADDRHENIWTSWLSEIEWIDLHEIFRTEPVVVYGSLTFSIKDIAKAMYSAGMIETNWDTSIVSDGFSAMVDAIEYYHKISQEDCSAQTKVMMDGIEKYNEVDCKVMWEITDYLRKTHTVA